VGELEVDALEGGEARRVEVFDHLHDGGDVKAGEAGITVVQRALEEPHALPLPGRQAVEPQAIVGDLQGAVRHVHPDNLLEARVLQQRAEQAPLAAAEIDDALRAALLQDRDHGPETQFVQADLLLDDRLLRRVCLRLGVRVGGFLLHQTRQRLVRQAPGSQLHCEVGRRAPFGEPLIKPMSMRGDRVPERLEQSPQELLAAAARQDGDPGDERKSGHRELGRSRLLPARALR
jgi:hypothetical protein